MYAKNIIREMSIKALHLATSESLINLANFSAIVIFLMIFFKEMLKIVHFNETAK